MTTIRTTCPQCGEVDMGPESILLSVRRGGSEGTYRFVCPECLGSVEKRADRKIVALLVSAGVDVSDAAHRFQGELDFHYGIGLPEDPEDEPMESVSGLDPADSIAGAGPEPPPFTIDDVIRMHFLLQDDRFLRELTTEH
jgi:predicted RNA-binding Zn-ribbon protein involved in translation (DUF1610 family)